MRFRQCHHLMIPTSKEVGTVGTDPCGAPWVQFIYIYIYIYKSLASFTQIAIIQSKNLTKIIKTLTMAIVFEQIKIYSIYIYIYFTTKEPKYHVLLEKLKLKFLQL